MREIRLAGYAARRTGAVALVDDEDYELVATDTWYLHLPRRYPQCYAVRHFQSPGSHTTEFMHNLIMGAEGVDHRNGNRLDNQRTNLRVATPAQNACNARGNRDTSSVYKGVSRYRSGAWMVQIQKDGAKHHVGYFANEIDAASAYDMAARGLFGEFARLNFPGVDDADA